MSFFDSCAFIGPGGAITVQFRINGFQFLHESVTLHLQCGPLIGWLVTFNSVVPIGFSYGEAIPWLAFDEVGYD